MGLRELPDCPDARIANTMTNQVSDDSLGDTSQAHLFTSTEIFGVSVRSLNKFDWRVAPAVVLNSESCTTKI